MKPAWYLHRLRCMNGAEILWRARNKALEFAWQRRAGDKWKMSPARAIRITPLPPMSDEAVNPVATAALLAAAEEVMAGRWTIFELQADLSAEDPDWSRDPRSGISSPAAQLCFTIPYRDANSVGSAKHVWELSRLHHVTLLASAYFLSGEERFASRAVAHLTSWWRQNPPLLGINWVSGIELGLRLIGWVWTRRLLDGMPGIDRIFEANPTFQRQLHAHQAWIATFYSRYSSANNHTIAEMAGLLSAALAFPMFAESEGWAKLAAEVLEQETEAQTFPEGVNRELASDYHVFVLELLLIAGGEADLAGKPMPDGFWRQVGGMADALAGLVDAGGRTARQGDSDSGRALLLNAPDASPISCVLDVCAHVFGVCPWWPNRVSGGVAPSLLSRIVRPRREFLRNRPDRRPSSFPAAGITVLRDVEPGPDEIWCRFDHGPHGFLTTSAHAHADALSIEVRAGGQEILTDPGTYCYYDERPWRDYFRSSVAHNTLEIGGRDQARHAGPFLWLTRPKTELVGAMGLDSGQIASVDAWHDGYATPDLRLIHRRRLTLDRKTRALGILDWMEGPSEAMVRLAFHFHPDVDASLETDVIHLNWGPPSQRRSAHMILPDSLAWRMHRGESDPILGWHSRAYGQREPSQSAIGVGRVAPYRLLQSRITFHATPDAWGGSITERESKGVLA